MKRNSFACAIALCVAAPSPAAAAVIFENFPTIFNNPGAIATDALSREVFVNFTPSADVTVRSIRWLGDNVGPSEQFRVAFYENANAFAAPRTAALRLATSTADSYEPQPFDFQGTPLFLEAIFGENLGAGITLLGGRNYQISISAISANIYAWKAGIGGCCAISRDIRTGAETLIGLVPGFGLYSTPLAGAAVPEPMSWAMMITGFGLTGMRLRRRKRIMQTA